MLFFLLLAVGAITSMVGLIEPIVSWLEEHRGFSRHLSAIITIGAVGTLSVFSVLSYNLISHWQFFGRDLNGFLDYLSNQILLPVGGLLIAWFVGWFMRRESTEAELSMSSAAMFRFWHLAIRYIVPPALLVILIAGLND